MAKELIAPIVRHNTSIFQFALHSLRTIEISLFHGWLNDKRPFNGSDLRGEGSVHLMITVTDESRN